MTRTNRIELTTIERHWIEQCRLAEWESGVRLVNEVCQYPYATSIGSEIELSIARDAVGGGHRGEYGDMLVEASGRCDWGLCCSLGGNSIQKYVCCMGTNL
jgi:hypothetical protein